MAGVGAEDTFEDLLVAQALALALNPTHDIDEIAHEMLDAAGSRDDALHRAFSRLARRSLEHPSAVATRATLALQRAVHFSTVPTNEHTVPAAGAPYLHLCTD